MFASYLPFPFLFEFPTEVIKEIFLSYCGNSTIHIRSNRKLSDLEYVDGIVLLNEDPNKPQIFVNRLNDKLVIFGMQFTH